MKFGNEERFSIDVKISDGQKDLWLMGRVCYQIQGKHIGDFTKETPLSDILVQTISILKDRRNRFVPLLLDVPKDRAFHLIRNSLIENDDRVYDYLPLDFHVASLSISPPIEVFFDWSIFLIDGENVAKILYARDPFKHVDELILDVDEFDEIFLSFYKYLNEEYGSRGGVPTELELPI